MKRNPLSPRAVARRVCHAHNALRRHVKAAGRHCPELRDLLLETPLLMDQDETRGSWESWSKPPLRHHPRSGFPDYEIPILSRPMTHAEARRLVAAQSVPLPSLPTP